MASLTKRNDCHDESQGRYEVQDRFADVVGEPGNAQPNNGGSYS